MDWFAAFIPIIVAALTIFGGAFAYAFQKSLDRRNEYAREKREIYRDYLASMQVYKARTIRTDVEGRRAAVEEFLSNEAKLLVFAPEHIAKKAKKVSEKFRAYIDSTRVHYESSRSQETEEQMKNSERNFLSDYYELVTLMNDDVSQTRSGNH